MELDSFDTTKSTLRHLRGILETYLGETSEDLLGGYLSLPAPLLSCSATSWELLEKQGHKFCESAGGPPACQMTPSYIHFSVPFDQTARQAHDLLESLHDITSIEKLTS